MKTKQNYLHSVVQAFYSFTKNNIDRGDLIYILNNIEKQEKALHRNSEEKGIWFRFGDSPGIYTIRDIENDLNPQTGTKNNRDFLIEQMEEAVSNDPDYLQINFS